MAAGARSRLALRRSPIWNISSSSAHDSFAGGAARVSESRRLSLLPWQVSLAEFTQSAIEVGPDGACCVFVVDPSIPTKARSGYASLVMAYSRADEPVCILEDGAALVLVREGGAASGAALARRVLEQMRKLALELTLTAGVAVFGDDPGRAIGAARAAAESVPAGEIGTAG
jgi:hypothetical protein